MECVSKVVVFWDVKLLTKSGEIIKAHAIAMRMCGGKKIQKVLTKKTKELDFTKFSKDAVNAFVDFIYLGASGLDPKTFLENADDLYELLRMAYKYTLTPLIDCCTNLISLVAKSEDSKKIKLLIDDYDNEHLIELYNPLSKKDPNAIKP